MKRILWFSILLISLFLLCTVSAGAKVISGEALDREWILENYTGKEMNAEEIEAIALAAHYRVNYTLDTETGELHILCGRDENGNKIEQKMLPYAHYKWVPWQKYSDSIKTVYVEEGILSFGRYSLYFCDSVEELYLPHSILKVDCTALYQCKNLKKVYYAGTEHDFSTRINYDEVRNWYAVDKNTDNVDQENEIKYKLKDKIEYGESITVFCKNEEGDTITAFSVGGYKSGDTYCVEIPKIEGIEYVGEYDKIEGKFKNGDKTEYTLVYHCDHDFYVSDPGKPCGSVCQKCKRLDPDPPVAHEWGDVEVKSKRGFLTPLEQSIKCDVCGLEKAETKMPYAPIICISVALPILLAGIVLAVVIPIRKRKKLKDLTW